MQSKFQVFCLVGSVLVGCSAQSAYALYDRDEDPYYKTALKEAESVFSTYTVQCNGKTFAKIADSAFIEFNKPPEEVRMIGAYGVSDSDRLNGKEWAGKFDVLMGKAARIVEANSVETVTTRNWVDSGEPEFDLVLRDKAWSVEGGVKVYVRAWYDLKRPLSCSEIPGASVVEPEPEPEPVPAPAIGLAPIKTSFDCKKASTPVEGMICGNFNLASLDVRVSKAYNTLRSLVSDKDLLKRNQKIWMRQRNMCQAVECLVESYTERARQLEADIATK